MSKRLKVLMSAYACEPDKGSEPEVGWQWALQMARFHDVTVLTRANNRANIEKSLQSLPPGQAIPRFVYHELSPWMLQWKKRLGLIQPYYIRWQRSAHKLVAELQQRERFDLFHHVTFAGFRYPTAIWGHGVPTIWGPVGGIESIPAELLPWRFPREWARECARNASNAIHSLPGSSLWRYGQQSTIVLASTREMQRRLAALRITALLMPTVGISAQDFPARVRPEHRGSLRLLYVGNLIALKGIDLALCALKESQITAEFTLVGSGALATDLKRMADRLGLGGKIVFCGQRPRMETLHAYAEHDLFIFPSLHDSGAFAVLEAMANELPIICLDCGGPSLSVQENCGIRVALGSRRNVIKGLAAAMCFFDQKRELLLTYGRAARQSVLENYGWDRKGAAMAQVYEQAMRTR